MFASRILQRIKIHTKTRVAKAWVVLSLLLVICVYALISWVILPLRGQEFFFPYHYTIYFGIDRIGAWYQTYTPALLATIIFTVNATILLFLSKEDHQLISWLVALLTLLFLVLTVIGAVLVVLLNLS